MVNILLLKNDLALVNKKVFNPKNSTLNIGKSQIRVKTIKSYSSGVYLIYLDSIQLKMNLTNISLPRKGNAKINGQAVKLVH